MLLNKIVVAEDDDAIAHMVSASLGDAGYLCLRARDGEEAVQLATRQLPDALILDVMMPKMSGIEVVRRLKADVVASRVPVLMLTSLGGVEDKVSGLEAGADDYLAKPFDIRELRARVRALIRGSRRERDRNPATDLPGAMTLEDHVADLMHKETAFAVACLECEAYQDLFAHAGFVEAQRWVHTLGEQIAQLARGRGFPAHLGGGDFVVVATPDQVTPLVSDIQAAAPHSRMRTTIVQAEGCQSVEDLAVRIAQSRGASRA
jgi:DNA-binding response OmpR family regulator